MITLTKSQQFALQNGELTVDELADLILSYYTVKDIAQSLVALLAERPEHTRISVTQQEFDSIIGLFRIKGINKDGNAETRGRKRKDSKPM